MVPEVSLPRSQDPANCPYPEPGQSILYLEDPLLYYTPICAWVFQLVLFPSGLPTKSLYEPLPPSLLLPIRATCPARLILLDDITGIKFGEKY